jgi:competence protein ComEA
MRNGLIILMLVLTLCPALSHAAEASPQAPGPAGPAAAQVVRGLDLNTVTFEEIQTVPGIGPVLARRILDHRQKAGPFKRVEDLLVIQGIGEKNLESLKPYFRIATPAVR